MRGVIRFWWPLAVLLVVSVAAVSPRASLTFQGSPMDTNVFRIIATQQNPTVVAIVTSTWRDAASPEEAEWFERFFGHALPRGPQMHREIASGVLISHDGDILTNDHVVADADVIQVQLMGQETRTYEATLVGRDPVSDSALIRLKNGPSDLPVATLGDSDALRTGDWVMAIGNPFQLGHSVSVGVVSYAARSFGTDRDHWEKLIQTDASINPGNSGGPLLNLLGEVVGINVAVLADDMGDSIGIGFAVPINTVKAVLAGLRAGRVVRGSVGVQLRMPLLTDNDATALGLPRAAGALITSVEKPSTANAAGLHAGDVIVEFLGLPIVSAGDFLARVSRTPPGIRARVAVIREGRPVTFDVEVEMLSSPAPRRESNRVERPDLGLTLADRTPAARRAIDGPLVQQIQDGSVAADAGIEKGDVVRRVNQRTTRTAADAMQELRRMPTGRTAFLLIWRNGEEILVEMPTE
jgi:serine protease Do